jgi:hypothetical protein
MPLKYLRFDFLPWRDAEVLHSLKTLEVINEQPAAEFLRAMDDNRAKFEEWAARVAKLPPAEQVKEVTDELRRRNAGFTGTPTPTIEAGVVTGLAFPTDAVTDLSPVRALPGLKNLDGRGSGVGKGQLADLWPLRGLKLVTLHLKDNRVTDLRPLKDLPLSSLDIGRNPVLDLTPLGATSLRGLSCHGIPAKDFTPLRGLPLGYLDINATAFADLGILQDAPLGMLYIHGTPVADLGPLRGKPLKELNCQKTRVTDLSPLRDVPLQSLQCDFDARRDTEVLKAIKTLRTINGKPAAEFWKDVAPP